MIAPGSCCWSVGMGPDCADAEQDGEGLNIMKRPGRCLMPPLPSVTVEIGQGPVKHLTRLFITEYAHMRGIETVTFMRG